MYKVNGLQKVRFVLIDVLLIGIISYLFYESVVAFIIFIPFIIVLYRRQIRKELDMKKSRVREEFKEVCTAFSSNLAAGYSMENSLKNATDELLDMYGSKSVIASGMIRMVNRVAINTTIENAFKEFANDCNVEEITVFAEILSASKRSSGNLQEIIKNTSENIRERIELIREIELIFASKKYEQKIMNAVPILIILYVKLTSPQMLQVMYDSVEGRICMTICLVVFLFAVYLSEKIMEIQI